MRERCACGCDCRGGCGAYRCGGGAPGSCPIRLGVARVRRGRVRGPGGRPQRCYATALRQFPAREDQTMSTSATIPQGTHRADGTATSGPAGPDMSRVFETIADGYDYAVQELDGCIPADLRGTLYRRRAPHRRQRARTAQRGRMVGSHTSGPRRRHPRSATPAPAQASGTGLAAADLPADPAGARRSRSHPQAQTPTP